MRTSSALTSIRSPWVLLFCAPALWHGTAALAQSESADNAVVLDEIVVTGVRRNIQDSIALKRQSVTIVDGLSADEIGDIPALSIAEALETLTGTATHRENGGGTEVSIRGLGPYLTNTVINGREATNGGGNRAVNFSIFPSELFNAIAVHKTQSAEYIEGGVGGQVHLSTRRPIDYGQRRIQLNLRGAYNPDEQNIRSGQDIGFRGTASYIDQFETQGAGTFGLSIGIQKSDLTNPEQEYTTGTGGGRLEACQLDSFDTNAQPVDTSGRCENVRNNQIQGIIDDDPNINSVEDIPFAYLARDHRYRQNSTGEDRESIFAAFQWQPDDRWNLNLDYQASERDQTELRQDVQFGQTQEDITNLVSDPRRGVPDSLTAETDIRANTTDFSRFEEYEGLGFNVEFQATDNLLLSFDASYSDTQRVETDVEINLGATSDGVIGSRDTFSVSLDHRAAGTDGVTLATINGLANGDAAPDFDITDGSFFVGRDRAQLRARQVIRDNTIRAVRGDFSLDLENFGFVNNVMGGVRFASQDYDTFGGNRNRNGVNEFDDQDFDLDPSNSPTDESDAIVVNAATSCVESRFPEKDFLAHPSHDQPLFTNANGRGNGSTFATFDHGCLADAMLVNYGGLDGIGFQNGRETNSNDVTEETLAFYLQANFETEIGSKSARGNFGVRVVETTIDSFGFRRPLSISEGVDGDGNPEFFVVADNDAPFEKVRASNSYTEVLPSATLIVDLSDDLLLRAGAFRGISRPDPNAFGNGRSVSTTGTDQGDGFASLEEAVQGITATGNPFLEPITSWNVDLALEWYPNEDTVLAGGVYWKQFNGAFENVFQEEDFLIDGQTIAGSVRTTQLSNDDSDLYGFEATVSHSFSYLPGFWGGFGAKISYNYADSDFEFEDGNGGDGVSFNEEGVATPLIGILPPAGLFGLSRHTSATQLYWDSDRFDVQAIYKTRSQYFQQFTRDTTARVRYTDDNNVLELRVGYQLTDDIRLIAEGLNLLNEPRRDYRGVVGNVQQVLSYGQRFFFGLKANF